MIPSVSAFAAQGFEVREQPTYTHKMDLDKERVIGFTDEKEAMEQAIYKIILTERFRYIIYSADYGIELFDLFGEPVSYVCPELERRITEALLWDSRITAVTDFVFDFPKKGVVHVAFTAHTIFGDVQAAREVNI